MSSAAPREETDRRPLPPGWRSYTSPEGLRYYVNSSSKGKTSAGVQTGMDDGLIYFVRVRLKYLNTLAVFTLMKCCR